MAAVFTDTLSAPACSMRRISSTLRIPPPTVSGIKHCAAVRCTTSTMVARWSLLAVMSRNTNSSACCLSYAMAHSTGSPASRRFTKFVPFTTRPSVTSKQGIILFASMFRHSFYPTIPHIASKFFYPYHTAYAICTSPHYPPVGAWGINSVVITKDFPGFFIPLVRSLADSEIRLTYGRKQYGYLSNVIPRRRRVNRNSRPVNPNNSSLPYQALRRRRATSAARASRERVAVVGSGILNNVGPIKACASDSIIPWKVCSTPLKDAVRVSV